MMLIFFSAKSYFSEMSFGEIALACLNGVRFDMASAAYLVMPFIFLFLMPVNSRLYLKTTFSISVLAIFTLILFGAVDAEYFGMFTKHITSEFAAAAGSIRFLVGFIISEYLLWVAVIFLTIAAALFICFRYINLNYERKTLSGMFLIKNIAVLVIFAFCAVIAARGKILFNNRPLKVMDASIFGNAKMADIALIGVFPAYEYTVKFRNITIQLPPPHFISYSI